MSPKIRAIPTFDMVVATRPEDLSQLALSKVRRLRRSRQLVRLTYWAAWAIGGFLFLLLVAAGLSELAAG